jgi:zinc transporter ZupT
MSLTLGTFLGILALCIVHIVSGANFVQRRRWTPTLLSLAAGISVSYIFLELLPDLVERQEVIEDAGFLPMLDRHVYIFSLLGLIVAFWVEVLSRKSRRRQRDAGKADQTSNAVFRLGIVSAAIENLAIGFAVGSPGDNAVEPLWLFVAAIGLHFLVDDHSLSEHHGPPYRRFGRWWLVAALGSGWFLGAAFGLEIPDVVLALALAYVSGGTILNTLRHELPDTHRSPDVFAFAVGAGAYTVILLAQG